MKTVTSVCSVSSHSSAVRLVSLTALNDPLLTPLLIHQYEHIFIKCSLSYSDKEEAIIILFWGMRYLALAKKYEFNMQALIGSMSFGEEDEMHFVNLMQVSSVVYAFMYVRE